MGRDKALIEVDGVAMARRVADALRAAGCRPILAVGGDPSALADVGLESVADRWPGEGPLGGILTALAAASSPAFVLACDLPWMDAGTLAQMRAVAAGPRIDVVVAATAARIEPLCAIWLPSAARHLQTAFDGGERAVHRALAGLRVVTHPVPATSVRNVNRPDDLLRGASP
jgi:molybdopterin-guanine dinucleotide biosynthesis protein A